MQSTEQYFLKMIKHLRQREEIMLYGNILSISDDEASLVANFLNAELEIESLHYPFACPVYDSNAALWAANTTYIAAQLMLYRENKVEDLNALIPDFEHEQTASAVISADLCLRFVPEMIRYLVRIDSDDPLIDLLTQRLQRWHFSAIGSDWINPDQLDFTVIINDPCLHQLYCNRIVYHKKLTLAQHPAFYQAVGAQLGLHRQELWKEFTPLLS